MRAVNLLPVAPAGTHKRLPDNKVLLAATAPLVAAALVYVGFSVEHARVVDARANVEVAQSELNGLGTAAAAVTAGQQIALVRAQRLSALRNAVDLREPWDLVLDQVSRVLPPGTWLTALNAQSPTPTSLGTALPAVTPPGAGSGGSTGGSTSSTAATTAVAPTATFTLSGYAKTNQGVAQALARLALLPTLTNVGLVSTTTVEIGKTPVVEFQIGATVAKVAS